MSDPFSDSFDLVDFSSAVDFSEVDGESEPARILLPIALALFVYFGTAMPWIVVRPFAAERRTYNLTDVKGGQGVVIALLIISVIGVVVAFVKRRVGLTILGISACGVGWLATISGLLFGVVGSLIPSIDIAGIDLGKAQVGQGYGVVVTVVAALFLGMLVIRPYEPLSRMTPNRNLLVLPMIAAVSLTLITVNYHTAWLRIESVNGDYGGDIPGDALFGSGLVLVLLYAVMGMWFLAILVRTRLMVLTTSVLSILIAMACLAYATVVWLGGTSLKWLLPSSADNWASIEVKPALYVAVLGGVTLLAISVLGFFPNFSSSTVKINQGVQIGEKKYFVSDLLALVLIVSGGLTILVAKLT
jgi:hypothetical protein